MASRARRAADGSDARLSITAAESGHHVSCSDFTFTDHFSRLAFMFHLHVPDSHSCFKFTFRDSMPAWMYILDSCIRDSSSLALILRRRSVCGLQRSSFVSPFPPPPPPPLPVVGACTLMGLASPIGTCLA